MESVCSKDLCTGCSACMNICPREGIHMEADAEGFLYPVIDELECVNCGKCKQVCPILRPIFHHKESQAYAVINKCSKERKSSSSGGFFSVAAKKVLEQGGVVIGASFDSQFQVLHTCIDDDRELKRLQGSKYVQSSLGDIYKLTKKNLEMGKMVLFTGTPCQIAGLITFLNKDYEHLITQDIFCHGVPSPKVWSKYLDAQKDKKQSDLVDICFRYKGDSWYQYKIKMNFRNATSYECFYQKDIYMGIYLKDYSIRPSCYQCQFKSLPGISDYTLGDFWGVDKVLPEMYDDKGTSVLILHTKRGQQLFETLQEQVEAKKVNIQDVLRHNPFAIQSVKRPKDRERFFEDLDQLGFFENAYRSLKQSWMIKFKHKIEITYQRFMDFWKRSRNLGVFNKGISKENE